MRGISISVVPLALLLCGGLLAQQQRQIEIEAANMVDPVIVTQVTVGGNPVHCKLPTVSGMDTIVPFDFGDDWLRQTDIYLFNRTNYPIAYGRLVLMFPESKTLNKTIQIAPLDFGIIPAVDLMPNGQPYPALPGATPISWGPSETYVVHLADYTDRIQRGLSGVLPNPTQVFVVKSKWFFTNGLYFYGQWYSAPDKQHPGQYKRADANFFPGVKENNWPVPGHTFGGRL